MSEYIKLFKNLKRYLDNNYLEVIPGISSMQLALARLKLDWHDLKISSLHGKNDKKKVLNEIKENKKVGLFTDFKFPANKIAKYLLEEGIKKL